MGRTIVRPAATTLTLPIDRRHLYGLYPVKEAGVYTNRIKTVMAHESHYLCPAPLTGEQIEELNWLAAATFRVTGCLDAARVGFHLDTSDNDQPYILEINPLPGLNPEYSDLSIEALADGWS